MDKTFPPADTFAGLNLGKFAFNAGDNTVKIVSREGGIDIDFFMITPELELFPKKQQKPVAAVAPERADAGIYFFRLQTGSEKRLPAPIPVRLGL